MFGLQIFTDVLSAYAYIMQLYPFIWAWEGVLRAHAHEFAKHMYMKIETYAHAHTQVEGTLEATNVTLFKLFFFASKQDCSSSSQDLCLWVNGEGWGQQCMTYCRTCNVHLHVGPRDCFAQYHQMFRWESRQVLLGGNKIHSGSTLAPLACKGDGITMFLVPCLQDSVSTLSGSFFAIFLCRAVSSCVYNQNHRYLVSERHFLAENKDSPYPQRAGAHLWRAWAILWDAAANYPAVIFVAVAPKQRSPKLSV